jgi:hypothetical protein
MEADDLLGSRNARPPKALAKANGTSRRASGWARVRKLRAVEVNQPPLPPLKRYEQAWKGKGSRQAILLACGTPSMKLWSFDARSKGQTGFSRVLEIGVL